MLELDCHLTKDGHVVVSHDEELLRQTGHDVSISSLNLEVRGQGEHSLLQLYLLSKNFFAIVILAKLIMHPASFLLLPPFDHIQIYSVLFHGFSRISVLI